MNTAKDEKNYSYVYCMQSFGSVLISILIQIRIQIQVFKTKTKEKFRKELNVLFKKCCKNLDE